MKPNYLFLKLISLIIVSLLINQSVIADLSGTIDVTGSNTVYPIMNAAGARFQEIHPDVSISISGPGSGAGISALIDGITDLAPMSRAPKQAEIDDATSKGMKLNITTIAIDAIVIIINKDNPIVNLNSEDISAIYSGNKTQWADFGWNEGGSIKVLERDENSGTHDYFNEEFLNGNEVDPTKVAEHAQFASTKELFDTVATEKNTIGYGGLAYLSDDVKAVNVNNVAANKANAKDGSYSVSRPLFIVFDQNTVSTVAAAFVNFVLSPEGQAIVEQVGYVAIGEIGTISSDTSTSPFEMIYVFVGFSMMAIFMRRFNKISK